MWAENKFESVAILTAFAKANHLYEVFCNVQPMSVFVKYDRKHFRIFDQIISIIIAIQWKTYVAFMNKGAWDVKFCNSASTWRVENSL